MSFLRDDFGEFLQGDLSAVPHNRPAVQNSMNNIQPQNAFQPNRQQQNTSMKMDLNSKIFASLDLKTTQAPVKFKPAISQIVKRKEVPSFHNASAKAADWTSLKFDDTAFHVEPAPVLSMSTPNLEPTSTLNNNTTIFYDSGFNDISYDKKNESNQQSNTFEDDDDFNDFQEASYVCNQQTDDTLFNDFGNNSTTSIQVQSIPQHYGQKNSIFQDNHDNKIFTNNFNSLTSSSHVAESTLSLNTNPQPNNPLYPVQQFNTTTEMIKPNYNFDGQDDLFQSKSPQLSAFNNSVKSNFYQSSGENNFQSNHSVFDSNSMQDTEFTSYESPNDIFKETEFGPSIKASNSFKEDETSFKNENDDNFVKETEFGSFKTSLDLYPKGGDEFSSFEQAEFQPNTNKKETASHNIINNVEKSSLNQESTNHFVRETEFGSFKTTLDSFPKDNPVYPPVEQSTFQPTTVKQEHNSTIIKNKEKASVHKIEDIFTRSAQKPKTITTAYDTLPPLDNGGHSNSFQDLSVDRPTTLTFTDDDPEFSSFEQAEFQPTPNKQESTSPNIINEDTISVHSTKETNNNLSQSELEVSDSDLNFMKPPDFNEDNISQSSINSNQFNWNIDPKALEPDAYYSNLKDNLFKTINQQDAVSKKSESPASIQSNENVQKNNEDIKPVEETVIPVIQESQIDPKADSYIAGYCSAWERCISSCLNIIVVTNNIFSSIPSASLCNEVVYSCKGQRYIAEICQVHAVVNRICRNAKTLKAVNEGLLQLEKQFQLTWHNLLSFCPNAPIVEEKSVNEQKKTSYCGVCLLPVNDQEIVYCESSYHASCANLWINQVDPVLPNLKLLPA